MSPGHKKWKVYEFDTPVIHVTRTLSLPKESDQQPTGAVEKECRKLMHRFTDNQVENLMDEAEKNQQ